MNELAKEIFRLLSDWIKLLKTAKKVYKWRHIPIEAIESTAKTVIVQINNIDALNSEEHKQAYINMFISIVNKCKKQSRKDRLSIKKFEKNINTAKEAFKEGYKNQALL